MTAVKLARRTSKPYQLKAPPRLDSIFPLLLSYTLQIRKSKDETGSAKRLHVDFSHVEEFDVLGVSIFLANLAKEIRSHKRFEFQVKYPQDKRIAKALEEVKIEDLLYLLGLDANPTQDLWTGDRNPGDKSQPRLITIDSGHQAILYTPQRSGTAGRTSLTIARKVLKQFYANNPSEFINYHQLQHVLDEIIKNTIDHSNDCGLTAIKFAHLPNGTEKITFVHCELGDGISLDVRKFLATSENKEDQRLANGGSTADFLHWAFLPGHTSKPDSGVNAGLGLSHIQSACRGGNIKMYFSDAQSIAYVTDFPELYTHKKLRRRLYHSVPIPCFMYFGETL